MHALQTLRYEFTTKLQAVEKANYEAKEGHETIVYDGRDVIQESDFTGNGARAWDYVGHRFTEGNGEGSHGIVGNVITINRTNTAGRYELYLKHFVFDGKEHGSIPASTNGATRTLCLRCEVKRDAGSHILRFVFKGEASNEVLDEKDYVVFNPDWQVMEVFFTVPSSENCLFRIDDLGVMPAPSTVQIRNLVLFEKR